jgi:hypothetical protein
MNLKAIKNNKGNSVSMALYYCEFCNNYIAKNRSSGKNNISCGCSNIRNYKHGGTNTRLYKIFDGIHQRCYNENNKDYIYYGKRGIYICSTWYKNFINFKKWALENGYASNFLIDRINNNLGYTPSNCRWVSSLDSNRNKTSTKLNIEKVKQIRLKYSTGKYTQKELAIFYKIHPQHVFRIIHYLRWNG